VEAKSISCFASTGTIGITAFESAIKGNDIMNTSTTWTPRVLSILRIVSGYALLLHGTAKLLGAPHVPMFDGLQIASLMGVAGIIELVAGALLLIGLFTRFAAFIASGFTAAAYFMGHVAPKGELLFPLLNGGEAAVLFCFIFLFIAFAGAGPWSVDAMRGKDLQTV
jgi:putative oxidoreductase